MQGVFSGFVQHDEAGGHSAQVPQRLHVRLNVTIAICWSECQRVIKEVYPCVVLYYDTYLVNILDVSISKSATLFCLEKRDVRFVLYIPGRFCADSRL